MLHEERALKPQHPNDDDIEKRATKKKSIYPIKNAAVTWKESPAVLNSAAALDERFGQISYLGGQHRYERQEKKSDDRSAKSEPSLSVHSRKRTASKSAKAS